MAPAASGFVLARRPAGGLGLRARRCALAAALLAGVPALACAPSPRRVPAKPRASLDRWVDPAAACDDAGNAYVAAIERLPWEIRVVVHTARGAGERWADPTPLHRGLHGARRRPQLAVGAPGEVYVIWEDSRSGPVDLYFDRSLDGGDTWLAENRRLNTNAAAASHLAAPALACDDRGSVYATWLDDREGFDAIYFNRSEDSGATWLAADVRISSLTLGKKAWPRLACDAEGMLIVVWVEIQGAERRILATFSHDSGDTWPAFEVEVGGRGSSWGPSLAVVEPRKAFVAWLEAGTSLADVHFAPTWDGGRTWEAPRRLAAAGGPVYDPSVPQVAVAAATHVVVAWAASAADGAGRLLLESARIDDLRFLPTVLDRPSPILLWQPRDAPRGAHLPFAIDTDTGGNVYLAWMEDQPGGPEVIVDRVADHGRTWMRLGAAALAGHAPLPGEAPLLAADDQGRVLAIWNEGDSLHVAASPFHGDSGWQHRHF